MEKGKETGIRLFLCMTRVLFYYLSIVHYKYYYIGEEEIPCMGRRMPMIILGGVEEWVGISTVVVTIYFTSAGFRGRNARTSVDERQERLRKFRINSHRPTLYIK